jgi:zinc transport system substrate-binding protein
MCRLIWALAAILFAIHPAFADLNVVVSIKPIHSLVATVMQGVGTPTLLIDGNNSPHTYSLKPSDAKTLQNAQVIFWVGHGLETFLEKPIESLGSEAKAFALMDTEGLLKLPVRTHEKFLSPTEADGDDHHDGIDPHIWLDPENGKAMLKAIAKILTEVDPQHRAIFERNADTASAEIDELSADLKAQLSPVRGRGFIVFHDAYQYFETRFDVPARGALSMSPENVPGAATIIALKAQIAEGKVDCVFAEPQFDEKLVDLLLEDGTARKSILDPLGAALAPGPLLYPTLLKNIATSLQGCLAPR